MQKVVTMTPRAGFEDVPKLLRETQLLENVIKDFVKHVNIFLRFDD